MKTLASHRTAWWWGLVGAVLISGATPLTSFAQVSQPLITSIRLERTNVVVEVSVPAGIQRVALESRMRLRAGAWAPVAVMRTDGSGGTLTFRIPRGQQSEMLRARAERSLPLPASFYEGTNSFWGPPTNTAEVAGFEFTGVGASLTDAEVPTTRGDSAREVVESDIWKVDGDTLYFFNQYRGLQVVDIADPDAAFVRGTLPLPEAGEQMYLAGPDHVILLVRNGCAVNSDESQVLVVSVTNAAPEIAARLSVPGWLQESRMVGDALYLASQTWRPVAGNSNTWEWGSAVTSYDLADPAHPVARGSLWFAGYNNVITATDTYLFVATQDPADWWKSILNIIDITAPDGTMASYTSVRTAGQIKDKFKINYTDGVLTTIAEDWSRTTATTLVTRLETFRLPDPRTLPPVAIVKLGALELGKGEQLHATRFDGKLVYVVTFFRIDPLWIVDLSDPAKPTIAGALDVPGWSTYILPLGSRLVSVGIETNRVAVSLFDVANPANPSLLSRVRLGQNYSWSEANNDEKAFTALTDIGLILVPYSGDTTNGWTSRVQLIDLKENELVARGVIEHQLQPRRATYHRDRVLSLSGSQLLSVDATDRDLPEVKGELELAWGVDKLFLAGSYLLELATSQSWWDRSSWAAVRVAAADSPDRVLARLALESLPIVGADLRDGRLYLVQTLGSAYYPYDADPPKPEEPKLFLTIVDVSQLPALSVLGRTAVTADVPAWTSDWEAHWPKPGVLVWAGGSINYWWWGPWVGPLGTDPVRFGGAELLWSPVMRNGGGHLLAFDVSSAAEPKFVSELNLAGTNYWTFSKAFTVGSRLYLSHGEPERLPNPEPYGTWVHRYYLDVIDYDDPGSPTQYKPVNVPGTLQGVSHGGLMLYTTRMDANGTTEMKEYLDASVYQELSVSLVASLPLPRAWPRPLLIADSNVLLGRAEYPVDSTQESAHQLETWTVADTKEFKLLGNLRLATPVSALVLHGNLLAGQNTDGSIALFDATNPPALVPAGNQSRTGCIWSSLEDSAGDLSRGLWLPLGMYGVNQVRTLLPP